MKHFFAIESARQTRGRYTFEVYQATSKGINWICSGSLHYSSTRGTSSEVLSALALSGAIPAKYAHKYHDETTKAKYDIDYIVPKNQLRN